MNKFELETLLDTIAAKNGVSKEAVRQGFEEALCGTKYAEMPLEKAIAELARKARTRL